MTHEALEYTCQSLQKVYKTLPTFKDTKPALEALREMECNIYAFSNGTTDATETLLTANIQQYFNGIVSVDEIKLFKPSPAVYAHFLRQSGAKN